MVTPTCSAPLSDAAFVRAAALHRDPRLADATYHSHGPNTMLPGDTIYVYGCPPRDGRFQLLAVSVPDRLVDQRDAAGIKHLFRERDAACAAGGPWWMKPLAG